LQSGDSTAGRLTWNLTVNRNNARFRMLNWRLVDVTLVATTRKPFDLLIEGPPEKESRGDPRRAFPDEAATSQNARGIRGSLPVPLPVPNLVRRGCGAGAIGVSASSRTQLTGAGFTPAPLLHPGGNSIAFEVFNNVSFQQ
jgi:hypothetical protein